MTPAAYVASEAVTAVLMHFTKTVVHSHYALLTAQDLMTGVILALAMVAGSWTARRFIKSMSGKVFSRFVDIFLLAAAISLFFNK